MKDLFNISFEKYSLTGCYTKPWNNSPCRLVAIHGARSDHRRLSVLLDALQIFNIGSLSFDLSGHTNYSPLTLSETSLSRNLQEALEFSHQFSGTLDTIFGHSLGGALAMKVAEFHGASIKNLILSCPAIYPENAYCVKSYGKEFSEKIAEPFGFLDSKSLTFLQNFTGRIILIIGQYDGLNAKKYGGVAGKSLGKSCIIDSEGVSRLVYSPIPGEVFEAIKNAVGCKLRIIMLADCDHYVLSFLEKNLAWPMLWLDI